MENSNAKLDFIAAAQRLQGIVRRTPLIYNARLSARYGCEVFLKREDLQVVRSYKLRGAYNMICQLSSSQLSQGIVCASAGNHAQGVAFSCDKLHTKGVIFMPEITPKQKVDQTLMFGNGMVEVVLTGDNFDDCLREALSYAAKNEMVFIPPFDDFKIIEGQGTVGVEIGEELPDADIIIVPIGGGGLAAGLGKHLKNVNPDIKIIGAEPAGAASMRAALDNNGPVTLETIDNFVDGAAVKRIGKINFEIVSQVVDNLFLVPEGKVCTTILKLYNEDAIVAEPAGALSVACLNLCREEIRGKKVVCLISGGNNDIDRMQEIKERSLLYEGLKHYLIIRFPQRPGALKLFVNKVLGPNDDISRFEFIKKNNRESGPALVGIELQNPQDYVPLLERLALERFDFKEINSEQTLFEYLV